MDYLPLGILSFALVVIGLGFVASVRIGRWRVKHARYQEILTKPFLYASTAEALEAYTNELQALAEQNGLSVEAYLARAYDYHTNGDSVDRNLEHALKNSIELSAASKAPLPLGIALGYVFHAEIRLVLELIHKLI